MSTIFSNTMKRIFFSGLLIILITPACERAVSDLQEPEFPTSPNVFIDGFSGGLEYAAFGGSIVTAFQVDSDVTYENSSLSMRFEVPDVNDPRGSYVGGTFFTSGARDLTGYNALTFYAKATESFPMDIVGFGNDLGANKYVASVTDFRVNSNWKKYIIPIPVPARLEEEKGMFFYSFGPIDGKGYTVWIDEVKFEKLGIIAQPLYEILDGEEDTVKTYNTLNQDIVASVTYNTGTKDQEVNASSAYFDFSSDNEIVASVDESGTVSVKSAGTATITASVNGVIADGSLTVESQGDYISAPTPTDDPNDVISLFSESYPNEPVDFYNGFYAPFQTTTSNDFIVNGDRVLNYENFNFVGIEFNQNVPTIDATEMTSLKMDIFIPGTLPPGATLRINLVDFGADASFGGGDDTTIRKTITAFGITALAQGQWASVDFDISGLTPRNNLGQIVFDTSNPNGAKPSSFFLDNLYFSK